MVAAADPPPAPPLTEAQAAILDAFLLSEYDLRATAAAAQITLQDLLVWHRHPAVQATLDDLEALQSRADELRYAAARRAAVETLHNTLRDPDADPIERRRAATALLRRNAPARPSGGTGGLPARDRPAPGRPRLDDARASASLILTPEGPTVHRDQRELLATLTNPPALTGAKDPPPTTAESASSEASVPSAPEISPPNRSLLSAFRTLESTFGLTDGELSRPPGPDEPSNPADIIARARARLTDLSALLKHTHPP